jgi:hypothetical protein
MARRGKFGRAVLLLGAAGVAAGAVLKREKVAGLFSSGSSSDAPAGGWAPTPAAGPSNYDAPGPVANTATPVPAPEPEIRTESGGIDEAAEEAAAAAEAANIGGAVSDYAGVREEDLVADEAERPLAEAGEGTSEGQEQAEAELEAAAEEGLTGASDFGASIDDAIEEAGRPYSGERLEAPSEPLTAPPEPAADAIGSPPTPPEPPAPEPAPAEPGGQMPLSEGAPPTETPGVPQTAEPAAAEPPVTPAAPQPPEPPADEQKPPDDDDDGDDWRTWSGQAVKP